MSLPGPPPRPSEQHHAFASSAGFYQKGLTKREWFAGQALADLAARNQTFNNSKEIVLLAYRIADEMVEQSEGK
jgi:hypothetical protein